MRKATTTPLSQSIPPITRLCCSRMRPVRAPGSCVLIRKGPLGYFQSRCRPRTQAGLALDAAGNAYLASFTGANYPVKNSLAACDSNGSSALTVLDGNGNVLQSTYIPGSSGYTNTTPAVGLGVDSTVYVVGSPTASSTPTQQLAQLSHFAAFPEPKCMKAGKS